MAEMRMFSSVWYLFSVATILLITTPYSSPFAPNHHRLLRNVNRLYQTITKRVTNGCSQLYVTTDDGLGAARALLFDDQHQALSNVADLESEILDPNMEQMRIATKKKRKQQQRKSGGQGFGGGSSKPVKSKLQGEIDFLASMVKEDGVVLIPNVLSKETAEVLRACVLEEIETMRDIIREDPSQSISLFYVPAEIHFSSPRGYVLLPLRDSESVKAGEDTIGPIVKAARELLSPGKILSGLFGEVLDGQNSQLYDFCALRTEPGTSRQVIHYDTPFQETPGLYCAFIALQDITFEMGGTVFLPKTHTQTPDRMEFENGDKLAMLKRTKGHYAILKAGDVAFFDMRTLHAGLPNLSEEQGGKERFLMILTFRNLNAKEELGHKPNLRPGYVAKYTLGEYQEELASKTPFVNIGDGLLR